MPPAPEFPLAPPSAGDWTLTATGIGSLTANVTNDSGGPLFQAMQFRGAVTNPPDPPSALLSVNAGDGGDLETLALPASYYAQARFVNNIVSNTPLSGWSTFKVVDLG